MLPSPRRLGSVFGPLNGVRTALVALAGVAALVAALFGEWTVTLVLGAGIAAHGALWLWLWRQRDGDDPSRTMHTRGGAGGAS